MKYRSLFILMIVCLSHSLLYAQYEYAASPEHPYGLPNPDAPTEIQDYQAMIGLCDCKSTSRNKDGKWAEAIDMTWEFKYIMNGMAVQDQTLKIDGAHSGSIRQYSADSSRWYVHYFSSAAPTPQLSTWEGGKVGEEILLFKDQIAPNGMVGKYKITFHDISEAGFSWRGEWVSLDNTITFPTWKIQCKKRPSK